MRPAALALLLALPAAAERPINPPATDFPPAAAWINATALSLNRMRDRKAVVVAFINPTSINSVRALPALRDWFDRYALSQLMVVGVLTPDLEFHRDPVWTKTILKRYGVDFPVILDSDRRVWKGYANDGWPALYLVDRKGRIVFDRLGEGGYQEFEKETRAALGELVKPEELPAPVDRPDPKTRDCGGATREIALGARRGSKPPISLDGDLSLRRMLIVDARDGEVAQRGRWEVAPDGLKLAQKNKDQGAFVRVVFHAAQALAVLSPAEDGKTRVFVKQDDLWLHEGNAGKDIQFDDDGRSFVSLDIPRLYDLTRDPSSSPHELYLIPDRKGAGVYGFSFSDRCLVTTLP